MASDALVSWLADADPALRWQVERDLMRMPTEVWQATRAGCLTGGPAPNSAAN
jgi:hypothetical protein